MTRTNELPTHDDKHEKKEESIRVITEKMTELKEVLDTVKQNQAVDKSTALGLEQICPGIITENTSVNGFTSQPSKTNYDFTVKCIESKLKVLGDEKSGILLEDEPFEKAELAHEEAEKLSETIDSANGIVETLEGYRVTKASIDDLLIVRYQLESIAKDFNVSIESLMPSMEHFASEDAPLESLIASMEAGIWDSIKAAMEKFWNWIKETFKKILDWFKGEDPAKRLQNIQEFMGEFKDDGTAFEFEITEAEAKKLTIGGKAVNDVVKPLEDFLKLAKASNEWIPALAKATLEELSQFYKEIPTAKTVQEAEAIVTRTKEASYKRYPILGDTFGTLKPIATVKTEESDKLILHYFGGFHIGIDIKRVGAVGVMNKLSSGSDEAKVSAGKYKLRASDAQKVGDLLTKIINEGWSDKATKELEQAIKDLEGVESKYKNIKEEIGKNEATAKIAQNVTMNEKNALTLASSGIMVRAAALRHIQMMEKFIIGLYKKAKKGENKDETNKSNETGAKS